MLLIIKMETVVNTSAIEITLENFQQIAVEESKSKLVLIDFWAEQIPESVELKNKLAEALAGNEETILFATVDCQAQQQIAQQFGLQALPTAIVLKDGQPIDGLSGPQTDEALHAFLDKYLPKAEDGLLAQAKQLLLESNVNEAFALISQAYQLDNNRADIKLTLAEVYIQTGKLSEAEALLATITMIDQDSTYQGVMAKLELAITAADSPEIKALEEQLESEPNNVELKQKLATQYNQVNRNEEALDILFRLMQKDSGDQTSKTLLLDILKALPDGDSLATKYRRKLYTLMY